MREETAESRGKFSAFVRGLFGNNPICKHTAEPELSDMLERKEVAEDIFKRVGAPRRTAKVPDYKNINIPMSVEEMSVCMIPEEWQMVETVTVEIMGKMKQLNRLFQSMDKFLEISRKISREPADAYKRLPPRVLLQVRVGKIQDQMRAIRFRLEIRDYNNNAELQILKDRLYQLYGEAKVIDPEGTARYERMIDKQIRRER